MKYHHIDYDLLPTKRELARSTTIAVVAAVFILVTVILPAEYGIDPTRLGKVFGLTRMGEIKMQLAKEAKEIEQNQSVEQVPPAPIAETKKTPTSATSQQIQSDTLTVTLAPNEGVEVKIETLKGSVITYQWRTDTGKVNWDLHADPTDKKAQSYKYSKGTNETGMSSQFTAVFDGKHGWFWRNRTNKTINITLDVSGNYTKVTEIR
jgi:hypothetical protein